MRFTSLNIFISLFFIITLITSCKKKGDIDINQVTAYIENCSLPYIVDFNVDLTYQGKDIDYLWDFGDGTTSKDKNPVHVYTQTGIYIAKLIVKNYNATKEETISVNIQTESIPVIADFKCESQYNYFAPAEIIFSNYSEHSSDFLWNFDDGYFTNDYETIHIFEQPGTYNVSLRAVCNGDTAYHSETINIYSPPSDIIIKNVSVWLPPEHLNTELKLRIYYDIFEETPFSLNTIYATSWPVSWNMYEDLFFFNGTYDADLLKFEIWDINSAYAPIYVFAIPTIEIARNHYPLILTWDDGNGFAAEVDLDYGSK